MDYLAQAHSTSKLPEVFIRQLYTRLTRNQRFYDRFVFLLS